MSKTDNFRRQHNELVEMVQSITAMMSAPNAADQAADISRTLSQMTGKLRIHLAQEDKSLYPRLAASSDTQTASTAKRFQEEMSGLGEVYGAYADKWRTPAEIGADIASFKTESEAVFAALADRIVRENTELYPLADKA